VTVYRICGSKYPQNDGEGSRLHGGRWNHKSTPLLYCGSTVSLCALDFLANSEKLPKNMSVMVAEIPDNISVQTLADADIPADWNTPAAPNSTKDIGTNWAQSRSSAILSVPSAIVPNERNYQVNPLHIDFARIRFSAPKPFVFDPRLKK
jgi:RES domain-containing protein